MEPAFLGLCLEHDDLIFPQNEGLAIVLELMMILDLLQLELKFEFFTQVSTILATIKLHHS